MRISLRLLVLFLAIISQSCVEAVEPLYELRPGFLLIEGQIADQAGSSVVRIKKSELLFGNYNLVPVTDLASVRSVDETGSEVNWMANPEEAGSFQPPADFSARIGSTYFLRIITAEGQVIESLPEPTPRSVPIAAARFKFEQEAYFNSNLNRFVPAFRLLVDVEDPADERNYYQWKYSTYEFLAVCARCERSVWRNGSCLGGDQYRFIGRYDYLCDAACWAQSKGSGIQILSDALSQGQRISNIEAGRIDFDWFGGLLADLQQINTSKGLFDYNTVLKNLSEGSGGLNAPLPAALIGNLRDVTNSDVQVLGYVGVVALNNSRIYINRDTVQGMPLPYDATTLLEPLLPFPPLAPCVGPGRSLTRPVGWPE